MNRTGDPGEPTRRDDELRELRELAAAYALDALDEAERSRFEAALPSSPELQAEVDAFRAVASRLGDAVPPVAPPPSLKASLFDRLDETPQEHVAAASTGPSVRPVPSVESDVTPSAEPVVESGAESGVAQPRHGDEPGAVDELAERRRRRRLAVVLSSAAAAAVLIVATVVGVNWSGPNGWGAQLELAQLAEAPDAQRVTQQVDGSEVTLIWSADEQRSAIVAEGLPDVGEHRTYELWYIDDSGAVPAGTFDARGDEAWRLLEGEFAPGVVVGITIEPAGGSPQPSSDPLVVFET